MALAIHQATEDNTEYVVSIRIILPKAITKILKHEKDRFVADYGSSYKSEPHITLYLDRYTKEGFPNLVHDLQELHIQPLTISLLTPEIRHEEDRHRNLYVMSVSNKEQLQQLQTRVIEIAVRYQSPFLRSKVKQRLEQQGIYTDGIRERISQNDTSVFDPHITLGEVAMDKSQPNLLDIKQDLKELEGKKIEVSELVVVFDGKADGYNNFKLIQRVFIPITKRPNP